MMMDSSSKIISLALLSLLVLASAGPAILRDGEDTRKPVLTMTQASAKVGRFAVTGRVRISLMAAWELVETLSGVLE